MDNYYEERKSEARSRQSSMSNKSHHFARVDKKQSFKSVQFDTVSLAISNEKQERSRANTL